MQDLTTMLKNFRRPRTLVRGAKIGAQDYNRDRQLQRLLGYGSLPGPGQALIKLMEMEKEHDDQRRNQDDGYSVARHLDLLIAVVGEAQLYQASRATPLN